MDKLLTDGYSILVYPEGTTHVEPMTRHFQRGAFGLAASKGIPILPIGIEYKEKSDAWVGNDTFIPHFVRCFGKKNTVIDIGFGPPLLGDDAKELASSAKKWIDEWLNLRARKVF